MSGCSRTPGPSCQVERSVWLDTGTSCLIESPSPSPQLDPFTVPAAARLPHAVHYLDAETVSYELSDAPRMCVQTSLDEISLAQMRVLAWLTQHRAEIIAAERRFRVDRRAIAGAIAWEALMNVHGRITQAFGRGVGPGKAHVWDFSIATNPSLTVDTLVKQVEDADWLPEDERLPKRSYDARKSSLETPGGAITYMAAAMNAAAHLASNAGFSSIRRRPEVLAFVWQKKDLSSWQQHLAGKTKGTDFGTGPDPNRDMDLWVQKNLRYLEDAVGTPQFLDDPNVEPVIPTR